MRQLTFFFCFVSLLSCSTDKIETLFNDNNSFKSEDSEHLETEMTKEYNFQNYSFSTEKRSSQDIQNEILKDLSSSQKAIASNLHGPFTITVPVPNPNPANVRVIYNKEHPPSVGTYITDVYNYKD